MEGSWFRADSNQPSLPFLRVGSGLLWKGKKKRKNKEIRLVHRMGTASHCRLITHSNCLHDARRGERSLEYQKRFDSHLYPLLIMLSTIYQSSRIEWTTSYVFIFKKRSKGHTWHFRRSLSRTWTPSLLKALLYALIHAIWKQRTEYSMPKSWK